MSWWKTAQRGDVVVCLDDDFGRCSSPLNRGQKYKVSRVGDGVVAFFPLRYAGTTETAWLEGIKNPHARDGGFSVFRFRPVQPKFTETGMSILKRILNGAPVREDA